METGRKDQRRHSLKELKQRDILDAAEQIFGQKGYLEASVQDIAELAEFSLSALYRLYDSKEALFAGVLARRGKEIGHGLHAILTQKGAPRQRLHQWVDFSISFHHQHPNYSRMYLLMVTTAVPLLEHRSEDEYYRPPDENSMTTQLFREGQRIGEFVSGGPMVLARLLASMVVTYLTTDPTVMGEAARVGEGFSLEQIHDMIDRVFCQPH